MSVTCRPLPGWPGCPRAWRRRRTPRPRRRTRSARPRGCPRPCPAVVAPSAASALAGRTRSRLLDATGRSSPARGRSCSPTSDAGPAEGPSSARSSGKPASTRSASRQVTSRGPRVECTSAPERRSSTSCDGRLGGHVVHELPVDRHHRRVVAGGVALDVLEGDLAVVGGLVVADVEVVLEPLEDQVAAHDRAERVGADADVVVADRAALVHRVEGRDPADLGGADAEDLGARLDAARR